MARASAVDVGSHGWKAIVVTTGKNGLAVQRFAYVPAAEAAATLAARKFPLTGAVVGLAGRDMTLRYTQVPPTPDWQLRNLMELEIQDLASQSGGELSADYNLLPVQDEESGMDTILMALARNDALSRVASQVVEAGGTVVGHVPNCIALYNAYLRCGPVEEDVVVALANLGHETIDIALVRGTDLLFARNLSNGGKVLDDAIAQAFNVSERKAETLKKDLIDLDPASRGRFASGQAEKVTMAAGGAAGMIVAAIQSSIAFCKSQTKIADLRLDKVLLSGGTARVRGIKGMLRESLRCPVDTFDPFANLDLSALPADEAEELKQARSEAVVALGLAAGRLDDSLYSLQILPESVKRRQRFMQRTIFDIAAGVVAVLLLVVVAMRAKSNQEAAELARKRLGDQVSAANSANARTERLLESNKQLRETTEALARKAIPLDGVLLVQRALRDTLPPEAWVQKLVVRAASARAGRTSQNPIVEVTGSVKPVGGVDVGQTFVKFRLAFAAHPLLRGIAQITPNSQDKDGKTVFTFTVDFTSAAPPAN